MKQQLSFLFGSLLFCIFFGLRMQCRQILCLQTSGIIIKACLACCMSTDHILTTSSGDMTSHI